MTPAISDELLGLAALQMERAHMDGNAIVYCQDAFATPNGKTAHGLVRHTDRYRVVAVLDERLAGEDAGRVLDGHPAGIPIAATLDEALGIAALKSAPATHLVIGLAPDGGRLPAPARALVREAIVRGLNIDAGLHDFLGDDPELAEAAREAGVTIRDVRRPPSPASLHFWSGEIREVGAPRVALLGTDSAVGKRTSALKLVQALGAAGVRSELIGTGQTAWMQGVRFGIVLDALVNDFVSGEIEHACVRAWREARPDVLVIEGQGSLLHPAYPGGYELLAAARPELVVLQHAPARREYDGFPGERLHPLERQVRAIETVSDARVVAVTLNHEGLEGEAYLRARAEAAAESGRPVFDVLRDGAEGLAALVSSELGLAGPGSNGQWGR